MTHLFAVTCLVALICLRLASAQAQPIAPIAKLETIEDVFYHLAWNPTSTTLAVASGNEVHLYDATLQLIGHLQGHTDSVVNVTWSPDGAILATASFDQTVKLWDVTTQQPLSTISALSGEGFRVEWSSDGQRLAIGAIDRSQEPHKQYPYMIATLWNVSNPLAPFLEHTLPAVVGIRSIAWSLDDSALIVANNLTDVETSIRFWNVLTGELEIESVYSTTAVFQIHDLARRPTSNVVAVAESLYAGIGLFNPANDRYMLHLEGHTGEAFAVDWNSTGERLVSSDSEGGIIVWDVATAQRLVTFQEDTRIHEVDWSPDDQRIATMGGNTVYIWDVSTLTSPVGIPTATFPPLFNQDRTRLPPVSPSVTIEQAGTQDDPTNSSPIRFTVQFSETVVGLEASDIDLSASTAAGNLTASVWGSDDIYTIDVSGMTSSGTVTVRIAANAVQNWAGIGNTADASTDNTVLYQMSVPTPTG